MNMVEKTGKTVEDAVKAALAVLGVSRDQVDVEVLEESKSSILGLFGGRDAKVRVTVKEVPAEEPSVPEPVAEIPEEKPEPAKGEVPEEPVQETKAPADRDAERLWPPRPGLSWKKSSVPWAWTCSSKNSSAGRMRKSS